MTGPKSRMGRPPKKREEKRGIPRTTLFTESEFQRLCNSTGTLRVSDSGFLRAAAMLTLDKIELGEVDLVEFLEIADS